ncbi:uncharacterized protein BO66DRAFT_390539 [Aspergillus aculeatinus CBS 121060]|uniref:Uncharacterized protein n=1 Tax=Aspergillus aculeatinus CBS 121060 TaxID=1448322 RepID=A0ACD1HCX2_9EURO|nr:hypothetical protein BO66DRAFT_390539 [Aspergillus aculeatinus CBS 121060]RAH71677.1 hypothetical protein BO66DRAFT_390539 [Aspergillus aculeatinus CBS 121060]
MPGVCAVYPVSSALARLSSFQPQSPHPPTYTHFTEVTLPVKQTIINPRNGVRGPYVSRQPFSAASMLHFSNHFSVSFSSFQYGRRSI